MHSKFQLVMKKTMFIVAILMSGFIWQNANAQVSINIGIQPVWGPVGYDYVNYYYMPDIDAYYDVPAHVYVYQDGGVWVRRSYLPPAYASFDLYRGYKVVVNDPNPWLRNDVYRTRYVSYKGHHDQVVIRDSREPRYYEVKEHPMHGQWKGGEGNHPVQHQENNHPVQHQGGGGGEKHGGGNGNGGGHGKGHDK
jgi:hypothetical protein